MAEGEGRLVAGRYRLRRSLGRGGMGVVWLAFDEYLHREVAVKEILPRGQEVTDTDPQVRRALREARAAAKLSKHAGIVTVHDVVTGDDGLPWIVMEVLHGHSLRTALETDGPMPVDRAARIGAQVLAALDYAHGERVLHRDVKPGNVMLVDDDQAGQAVLTDFGIAVLEGVPGLTATGQIPGSPEYVAPERIRGEETSPAADLWSVGVMLYTMVVGRGPFHRVDIQAMIGAALSLNPDPDPRLGRLAPVIDGLLRKNPTERMTARQAIAALAQIVATREKDQPEVTVVGPTAPDAAIEPLSAPHDPPPAKQDAPTPDPGPPPPHRPRSRRGRRRPWIAAGAGLVVVAVVVTIAVANRGENTTAPTNTHHPTTTDSLAPMKTHQEPLGFEIDVPADWQRTNSTDGPVRHVIWRGRQVDPAVGVLEVRVTRDTTAAGVPANTYLADEDDAMRANPDNLDYQAVTTDHGSSADLEYTYRTAAGPMSFHAWVRAMAPGDVYTLTFLMFARDAGTLEDRWRAAEPLMAEIRDSFRLTA